MVKFRSPASLRREGDIYRFAPTRDPDVISELFDQHLLIMRLWQLTVDEAAALLDVSVSTWSRIKAGKYPSRLGQDIQMRLAYIAEVHEIALRMGDGLNVIFLNNAWGERAAAPLNLMIRGGIPNMRFVIAKLRNYQDAILTGRSKLNRSTDIES
jgi:hypothetical protein